MPRLLFLAVHAGSRRVAETVQAILGAFLTEAQSVAVLPALHGLSPEQLPQGQTLLPPHAPAEWLDYDQPRVQEFLGRFAGRYDILVAVYPVDGAGALPEAWVRLAAYFALLLPREPVAVREISSWLRLWQGRGLPLPDLLGEEDGAPLVVAPAAELDLPAALPPALPKADPAAVEKRQGLHRRLETVLRLDKNPRQLPAGGLEQESGADLLHRVEQLQALALRRQRMHQETEQFSAELDRLLADLCRLAAQPAPVRDELIRLATEIASAHGHLDSLHQEIVALQAALTEHGGAVRQWLDQQLSWTPDTKREAG